ncbi:MAG: 16S rRNA (guanine(966)-N(2))-methyltransferase RsmD [Alphaproteobacteria bacterium]|jgi:16S rRNA (guanine966-N2)-methyltransferase|nr:16S rRNA (guanine(966)-N(2))-methyltransferase RsmD [Alphaproteobacteria bacterium]
MLKIISGRFRQKRLYLPNEKTTRPTMDRVREAIFNILLHQYHIHFDQITVLDAFAGSGAMGLESLSRGAKYIYFVEQDVNVRTVLQKNIELILSEKQTTIFKMDVLKLGKASNPVDLVFLDPPYKSDLIQPVCLHLYKQGWVQKKTLLCIESASKNIPVSIPLFNQLEQRIYGHSGISFWKLEVDPTAMSRVAL